MNPTIANQSLKQEVQVPLTEQISKWTINDSLRTHDFIPKKNPLHRAGSSVGGLSLFGSAWVDCILDQDYISSGLGHGVTVLGSLSDPVSVFENIFMLLGVLQVCFRSGPNFWICEICESKLRHFRVCLVLYHIQM